ncbi:MAG: ANTAR domain-containing response regulator [Acidimicrobiales bacterium]
MSQPASSTHTPVRVVVAEDEAIVRLDVKEILLSAGYEVVGETGRGDDAVALAAETKPDLAILDVKMPGMSGIQAAREITRDAQVAVIVLTAFSQRELIEEARDAGVAAYLVKPFRRDELLGAVDTVLASCRQDWAIDDEIEQFGADGSAAEDKIATRRIVDEAKGRLIESAQMTEPEAFSFIQRTAMRTRTRMREVAGQVIEGTLTP